MEQALSRELSLRQFPLATGGRTSIATIRGTKPYLALVFTSVHCPYALEYFDFLEILADSHRGRSVGVIMVSANRSASRCPEGIITLRRKFSHCRVPIVRDARGVLVDELRPLATPTVFLLGDQLTVLYRGAIDDRFRSPAEWAEGQHGFWPWDGSGSWVPRNNYLLDAIDAVLDGRPVAMTAEIGCAIGNR